MARRSTVELLPPPILAVVHEAIVEGATIDEIVRRMRAEGGRCSRSAVFRYVRPRREMLRRWREESALADFRRTSLGGQPEGESGRQALETLRSLAMRAATVLDREEKPPDVDQIATLALAMQRIESAGRSGADRRSSAARGVTPLRAGPGPRRSRRRASPPMPSTISAPPSRAIGASESRTTDTGRPMAAPPSRAGLSRHEPFWTACAGPVCASLCHYGPA